jgi:hypothetical protein
VQPVLVDRGQLAAQSAVQVLDDLGVALHIVLARLSRGGGAPGPAFRKGA